MNLPKFLSDNRNGITSIDGKVIPTVTDIKIEESGNWHHDKINEIDFSGNHDEE